MADASTSDPRSGLRFDVSRRFRPLDIVVLLAPPVVLLGIFALPSAVRAGLVFERTAPTLLTAFGAHFVHLQPAHLLGNLAVYALVAPTVYLLFLLAEARAEFLAVSATILLLFPFVLTGLDTLVLHRGTLVGFSGLAMAYTGVLPVAAFLLLDERTDVAVGLDDAPVFFLAGMSLIAVRVAPGRNGLLIAVVVTAVALAYAARIGRALPWPSWTRLRGLLDRSGYVELVLATPVVFAVAILAAFPTDPVGAGTVVNLFGHLLGYSLGFLATYVTVRLDRAVGGESPASPQSPPEPPADHTEGSADPEASSDGGTRDVSR